MFWPKGLNFVCLNTLKSNKTEDQISQSNLTREARPSSQRYPCTANRIRFHPFFNPLPISLKSGSEEPLQELLFSARLLFQSIMECTRKAIWCVSPPPNENGWELTGCFLLKFKGANKASWCWLTQASYNTLRQTILRVIYTWRTMLT